MISAVIVTDLNPAQTRKSGLPRLAGTVLGASLGALICFVLKPGVWEVGLGIFAAMLLSHLMQLRNASKIAGYVCGIVLLDHTNHPWVYALHRTIETVIGISVAILVSLVPKLISTDHNQPGAEQDK